MDKTRLVDIYTSFRSETDASVDDILCDPDFRTRFLKVARLSLGDELESDFLRTLLNLRKQRRIPKAN